MHASAPLPEDATVRHVIDANRSSFSVQVLATGLLSAFGHSPKVAIRDFDGSVEFTVGSSPLAGARMTLKIRANSLETDEGVNDKDRDEINRRMRQEVLETDDYPEIRYECTGVTASGTGDRYWVALKGELTLHGTTKPMPVSARVTINGNSLRATGDFALRQTDFGITPVSAAAGTIRVKDEVKCTFDILAHRQE
jgi:polyisoprenoid-binding protein YceI